jgi:hypothetical protein
MDEKNKGTKKTIADELLEDNFFKPPIEDIIEETHQNKNEIKEDAKESQKAREDKGDLLFEDFLKSPAESSLDEISELTTQETSTLSSVMGPEIKPSATSDPRVLVTQDTERTGSKLKAIIASFGVVIVLLVIGFTYIYVYHPGAKPLQNKIIQGSQSVELNNTKPGSINSKPAKAEAVQEVQQTAQSTGTGVVAEQQGNQPSNTRIAENIPPVVKTQPNTEVTKQFEVILENIRSKAALNNVKHIGQTIDNALNFDVTENKTANTAYSLFVEKVYPSEGEATADNLKLMVANISNASIVRADGGYRILIGKYNSKARTESNIKDVQAAGLKGLIKETQNISYTYNVKVYPFKSAREAETYQTKVKKLAAKVTSMEMK